MGMVYTFDSFKDDDARIFHKAGECEPEIVTNVNDEPPPSSEG